MAYNKFMESWLKAWRFRVTERSEEQEGKRESARSFSHEDVIPAPAPWMMGKLMQLIMFDPSTKEFATNFISARQILSLETNELLGFMVHFADAKITISAPALLDALNGFIKRWNGENPCWCVDENYVSLHGEHEEACQEAYLAYEKTYLWI